MATVAASQGIAATTAGKALPAASTGGKTTSQLQKTDHNHGHGDDAFILEDKQAVGRVEWSVLRSYTSAMGWLAPVQI
jgi:hypothetical protein